MNDKIRAIPPIFTFYQAVWAMADWRCQKKSETIYHVQNASRNKHYTVEYHKDTWEIMSDDDQSFLHSYLWYPGITTLLHEWTLPYDKHIWIQMIWFNRSQLLVHFKWDYSMIIKDIHTWRWKRARNVTHLAQYFNNLSQAFAELHLKQLWCKVVPPINLPKIGW